MSKYSRIFFKYSCIYSHIFNKKFVITIHSTSKLYQSFSQFDEIIFNVRYIKFVNTTVIVLKSHTTSERRRWGRHESSAEPNAEAEANAAEANAKADAKAEAEAEKNR